MALRPFVPDKNRGVWSTSNDFLYACVCNAFRMDVAKMMGVLPRILFGRFGMILMILPYAWLYAIPVIFIQSFLGQFSSSGFISAFRISPLFKGLGYLGLVINLLSLGFYSIFTAVPLLYLFYSARRTLPWSCEGAGDWMSNDTFNHSPCYFFNDPDSLSDHKSNYGFRYYNISVPSVEFFKTQVQDSVSFPLLGCVLVVWVAIALVLNCKTEKIGMVLRYSACIFTTLLLIVFIRMSFLPSVKEGKAFLKQNSRFHWSLLVHDIPSLMFTTFGPGWGSILSMASYNKFRTNISKYSWLLFWLQFGILIMTVLMCKFAIFHLTRNEPIFVIMSQLQLQWMPFLVVPSSLSSLELPHLWTCSFLIMLITASFSLMLVQVFSVFTALFDEFEKLRPHRTKVILGTVVIMAIVSGMCCSNNVLILTEIATNLNIFTHGTLNFMLLFAVVWIYGRQNFQKDMKFMTNQVFETWKVYVLKFVTPVILMLIAILGYAYARHILNHYLVKPWATLSLIVFCLSWAILPTYCFVRIYLTDGTIGERVKKCFKPTDWYPVGPEDKQQYKEADNYPEPAQPLTVVL